MMWPIAKILMSRIKNDRQHRNYVLKCFGQKEGEVKKAYRDYVHKAINAGRRPELVGGGLIRSQGVWACPLRPYRKLCNGQGNKLIQATTSPIS